MSKIIVVEGPDRVGKATQSRMLKEKLTFLGKRAKIIEVPIKSPFNFMLVCIYFLFI